MRSLCSLRSSGGLGVAVTQRHTGRGKGEGKMENGELGNWGRCDTATYRTGEGRGQNGEWRMENGELGNWGIGVAVTQRHTGR